MSRKWRNPYMLFKPSPFSVLRSILSLKWSPGCLSRKSHLTLPTTLRNTHWQRHQLVKNTLPSCEFYDRSSLKRNFLSVPTVEAPRTLQQQRQQQDEVSTLAPLIIPPPPAVGIPLALRMAAGEKLRPPQV